MPKAELRERLAEMHQELERTPAVDDEARSLLATLAQDIHGLIDTPEGESPEHDHPSLRERLAEAVRHFEQEHPEIAGAVGRVADTLSNLGI